MTVAVDQDRVSFAGDGVTTSFATNPVIFFDATDLRVLVVVDATGVETELVLNTNYTVTGGNGAVGNVVTTGLYGAVAVGNTLVIIREVPLTQAVDLVNNDVSDAEVQERALDKLTLIAQQLSAGVNRSARLPDGYTGSASAALPAPDASKFLAWNASATALVNTAGAGSVGGPASSIQFNDAGTINGVNSGSIAFAIDKTTGELTSTTTTAAAAGQVELHDFNVNVSGHAGGTSQVYGLSMLLTSTGGNNLLQDIGVFSTAQHTGSGSCSTIQGVVGQAALNGAGTATTLIGASASLTMSGGGNVSTALQGFRVSSPSISGAGTTPAIEGFRASNLGHANITDVFGVLIDDQTGQTGAAYAYYTSMNSGTNKYAFYAGGTAPSAFTGSVWIGNGANDSKVVIGGTLPVTGNISRAEDVGGTFPSTATTSAEGIRVAMATAAASFTAAAVRGVRVNDTSKGSGSAITVQSGVYVADLAAGGTNYAVDLNVTSGSNKWNVYAQGSAPNYFAGPVRIAGTTDDTFSELFVVGTGTVRNDATYNGQEGNVGLRVANATTPAKNVAIGYDGSQDFGFIKAIHDSTDNKHLALQPVAKGVMVGTLTQTNLGDGDTRTNGALWIKDGMTAPTTTVGFAAIYVDTADGDLKVKFGDGTVKTIVIDT